MHRPPLPPGNAPGTHFCYRLSRPQGHSAIGRFMLKKNSSDAIGNRTRDLPTCSAVPQPTTNTHTYMYVCIYIYIYIKVNVKWSRYRPGVAQRVGRGIALLLHDRGIRRGWMVSFTPRPHFTPRKDPVPIVQEAGWAPGPVWTGGKSRPHRDSIPDRPACSSVAIPTELPGPYYCYYYYYYHNYIILLGKGRIFF